MIKVIDAIPGAGKSHAIFKLMYHYRDDCKFIYISPFLSEIEERVPQELPELNFKTPSNKGDGKLSDFKTLALNNENIASTHALFGMFTPEIVDILIEKQYVIIIDEALQCIGLVDDGLNQSDVYALLKSEMVSVNVEDRYKVEWNEDKYPEHTGKYATVRNMANMGCLYCFEDKFLMFEYPPKLLKELDDVFILTYLFKGSDMRCWLDINGIQWKYLETEPLGMRDEEQIKQTIRENLQIVSNRSLDNISQTHTSLSSTWFKNAPADEIGKYRSIMRSLVVSNKVKTGQIFWTTYKKYKEKLENDGYRRGASPDMPAFLPLNTRSTNKYKEYTFCIYACNLYVNPVNIRYMSKHGIKHDVDTFALSEMIQFLFRGAIRKGEPMKVVILSKRMKTLLESWLGI